MRCLCVYHRAHGVVSPSQTLGEVMNPSSEKASENNGRTVLAAVGGAHSFSPRTGFVSPTRVTLYLTHKSTLRRSVLRWNVAYPSLRIQIAKLKQHGRVKIALELGGVTRARVTPSHCQKKPQKLQETPSTISWGT